MHLFCSPYRNHQCGLQPAVWQVVNRSLFIPAAFPSFVPLIGLLPDPLDPLSSLLTCHNAHQRVPHSYAHECGGVPHRPALHDPGEITAPLRFLHKQIQLSERQSLLGSINAVWPIMKWNSWSCRIPCLHTFKAFVCWQISQCKFWKSRLFPLVIGSVFLFMGVPTQMLPWWERGLVDFVHHKV